MFALPARFTVTNEGLGWGSLPKMVHNPGGDWHPGSCVGGWFQVRCQYNWTDPPPWVTTKDQQAFIVQLGEGAPFPKYSVVEIWKVWPTKHSVVSVMMLKCVIYIVVPYIFQVWREGCGGLRGVGMSLLHHYCQRGSSQLSHKKEPLTFRYADCL